MVPTISDSAKEWEEWRAEIFKLPGMTEEVAKTIFDAMARSSFFEVSLDQETLKEIRSKSKGWAAYALDDPNHSVIMVKKEGM